MPLSRSITLKEFLAATRMSETTFYRLRKKNKGPRCARVGGKLLLIEAEAQEWLERQFREAQAA